MSVEGREDGSFLVGNSGSSVRFDLTLSISGESLFYREGLVLDAGSTYRIAPDWTDLSTVPVELDRDSDGVADETLSISANTAPLAPTLESPSDGSALDLAGDPAVRFEAAWTAATDADGDALAYRLELAAAPGFDPVLWSVDAGTGTTAGIDFGTLAERLASVGAGLGSITPVYLRVVASDGTLESASAASMVQVTRGALTGIEGTEFPTVVELDLGYPNPMTEGSTIRFGLPDAVDIRLELVDMLGRRVRTLAAGFRTAGWHTVRLDAADLPAGTYIYRLSAGDVVRSRTIVRVRGS